MKKIMIPGIEEKISRKIAQIGLKPLVSPKEFLKIHKTGKHRYFSPAFCGRKKIGFFARLHDNADAKNKFLNEINFLENIKKTKSALKNSVPVIFDWGKEKDFEWLVRELPAQKPLGHSRDLFKNPDPRLILRASLLIKEISEIPPKYFPHLKKFNPANYLPQGAYQKLASEKIISADFSEKITGIIKDNLPLARKENHYFCHGDLNLGNVLAKGKDVWIIDWELIHLNNFAYDIGYFWAHLWEAKQGFRQKLMKTYVSGMKKDKFLKFKKLLPLVASYLSLGGIEMKKEQEKKALCIKRRAYYVELLKRCVGDFDRLIKI